MNRNGIEIVQPTKGDDEVNAPRTFLSLPDIVTATLGDLDGRMVMTIWLNDGRVMSFYGDQAQSVWDVLTAARSLGTIRTNGYRTMKTATEGRKS